VSTKLTALKRCQFIGGETPSCNDRFKQMDSWQAIAALPPPPPVQHPNFSVRNFQSPYKIRCFPAVEVSRTESNQLRQKL